MTIEANDILTRCFDALRDEGLNWEQMDMNQHDELLYALASVIAASGAQAYSYRENDAYALAVRIVMRVKEELSWCAVS